MKLAWCEGGKIITGYMALVNTGEGHTGGDLSPALDFSVKETASWLKRILRCIFSLGNSSVSLSQMSEEKEAVAPSRVELQQNKK